MEKIGNVGWFMTNEEKLEMEDIIKELTHILKTEDQTGFNEPTVPYNPNQYPVWKNPADWTWRPWQAPWYGPGDPVPTEYKIGDGEWWKNQPYCTSTTGYDPNVVKDTLTAENKSEDKEDPWKEFKKHIRQK
jgi:hypothetical protein